MRASCHRYRYNVNRLHHQSQLQSIRSFFNTVDRNWETAWKQSVTPWETKTFAPPLHEFFNSNHFESSYPPSYRKLSNKRALVAGCGSGYDVLLLHQLGFKEVIGLDLSSTAIEQAKKNISSTPPPFLITHKDHDMITSESRQYSFQCANFFEFHDTEGYDFIFDYLFFSAIDINMRVAWAESMASLLCHQHHAILCTLMFPYSSSDRAEVDASYKNVGPPYLVTEQDYRDVLEPHGLHIVHAFDPQTSIKPRRGRERVLLWTKH